MSKELNKRLELNISSLDKVHLAIICLSLAFIFNPLYLLLFFVLVERWIKLPVLINFIIAISIALLFINREIGGIWSSVGDANYANDDALNYLSYYRNLFDNSFFSSVLGLNIFNGGEPLWFIIAYIVSFVTNGNEFSIVLVSVLLPILILHLVFLKISRDFCFNAAFFYIFFPEINHIFYHLWRFSLSLVITLLLFTYLLTKNRMNIKLVFMSFFAHVSSVFTSMLLILTKKFSVPAETESTYYQFIFILRYLLFSIIVFYALLFVVGYMDFYKLNFYLRSDEITALFEYSKRHFLYILFSVYLLLFSKKKIIISVAILNLTLLLIPFFIPVTLIYERILLLTIPPIVISFLYQIKNYARFKNIMYIPMLIFFLVFVSNVEGKLFYVYMSRGHAFSLFNGIFSNILDIIAN